MDRWIDPLAGKALSDLKVPIIRNPKKPELAQWESTTENDDKAIFQENIKEYVKYFFPEKTMKKLYGILWGQTSERKRVKVQAVDKFK